MVLTDEERKEEKRKYDREYRLRPEVKAKTKERYSRIENKAKKKDYDKIHRIEYSSRPEVVARRKERESRPEVIAKKQEYNSRPEVLERRRERESRPEVLAKRREFRSRPEEIAKRREIASRPEVKAKKKEYGSRPEVKAKKKEYGSRPEVLAKKRITEKKRRIDWKLKTCSVYSKRHSNSDVPCCRCCGENSFIEFLTIDHIEGRTHLPKEQKDLTGNHLVSWLTRNNYPEGFQILCWNCNVAKGDKECPHLEMRK